MNAVVELMRLRLPGPRWEVTRDVVSALPESVEEAIDALEHDLPMLVRLLEGDWVSDPQNTVDTRITAEHVVLLLGRVIPAVNSILGDLYMTDVSDIEDDDRDRRSKEERARLRVEVEHCAERWRLVTANSPRDARDRVRLVLDAGVIVAEMNAVCVRLLRTLLIERL